VRETPRAGRLAVLLGWVLLAGVVFEPAGSSILIVDDNCSLVDAIEAANADTATGGCPAGSGADETSGSRAVCAERSAGQRIVIQLGGETSWNCLSNGLEVTTGDLVLQNVLAEALSSEVGGSATGLASLDVRCKNNSTGKSVGFQPGDGITTWSCSAAGLVVTAGDDLRLQVSGIVE
jgi:hypothetical protein